MAGVLQANGGVQVGASNATAHESDLRTAGLRSTGGEVQETHWKTFRIQKNECAANRMLKLLGNNAWPMRLT